MSKPHITLDARGLVCPEPVIEAEQALRAQAAGCRLTVLATDPAAPIDFEAWCHHQGHAYLGCTERDAWLEIVLRKGPPKAG
jgi:tRNA 2-thiouridine synthesizing protein A